jgi:fibronectin-binding autotransporter adhesin
MKMTTKFPLFRLQICTVLAAWLVMSLSASAAEAVWTAVLGTSADTNWSDLSNWQGGVNPSGNACLFNDTTGVSLGSATINNVVNTAETPASLTYTNLGTQQNMLILPGVSLTVEGNLTAGNTTIATNANPVTTVSGAGGTLVVTNSTMSIGQSYSSASASSFTFNMAGLSTFIATNMAHVYAGEGSVRMSGIIDLATNNVIACNGASSPTSPNLDVGDNSSNNGPGDTLNLGQTNIFFVNDVGVGLKKQNSGATIQFNSAFTSSSPVAYFYGTNGVGSRVATWAIADGQTTGGTITDSGLVNFTGGTVTALINSMWIGRDSSGASAGSEINGGTLTFSLGNINVNNLTNGWVIATNFYPEATGIINVNGTAVLSVNNNFVLATTNSGLNLSFATVEAQGELNINGGTVEANKITTGGMGNSGNGVGSYIEMVGGTLAVTNILGTPTLPINYLYLSGSPTLQLSAATSVANAQINNLFNVDSSTATINISAMPAVTTFPIQFPVITYQGASASGAPFALGTLPPGYSGYISNDNSSTVWLVVTNGPVYTWGGGVNGNWDTTTLNWTNDSGVTVAYADGVSVVFNDLAQTANVGLTAPHAPLSWTVNNSVLNYTFSGSGVTGSANLSKTGTANLTLTESGDNFSGGVSASGGTVVLDDASSTISGGLSIAANATVQIGNNDANGALPSGAISDNGTLTFDQTSGNLVSAAITGSGSLVQEGNSRLALGAANSYSGNTTVTAGTLALTNAGSIASSPVVAVTGATLDFSGVSGTVTLANLELTNSAIDVADTNYLQTPIDVANLGLGNFGNTINVGALPPIASYPATLVLVQSANPITGTSLTLGTLPSASYSGSVSISGSQILLNLTGGPVGVRPYVSWSGADVPNLHTNWSDNANWLTPGAPSASDNVVFNQADAQASSALTTPGGGPSAINFADVNNIVNNNFTVSSLIYTNVGGTYHNTYINNGDSLTIANSGTNSVNILSVGSSSTDFGASAAENTTISGPNGTLNVNNTNDTVFVGLVTGGAGTEEAILDMSGLGSFNASINSLAVGAIGATTFGTIGTAYLARTNIITAVGGTNDEAGQDEVMSLMVGETGKNGSGTCYLYLGQQNTINANYIGVSLAKESAEMEFNPTWSNPSATIRAADGVSPVAVWSIGDALAQTGGSTSPTGMVDFTSGTVNALATTMYLGRSPNVSGGNGARGTLAFSAGTISVGTLYAGYQAFSDNDYGVGLLNVSGTGLLQVGTLNLGVTTGGSTTNVTSGTLNINGATVQAGTITAGASSTNTASIIDLNGGTLAITNNAGLISAPLTALNLVGGTLQLSVNGSPVNTNVIVNTVTTSGTTTLRISSLAGVTTGITYPLISYTGTDPYSSLSLVLPAGYTGSLVDNSGVVGLQLTVVPPSQPPRFTGISVSGNTLTISGTNGPAGGAFVLLETTNLAPPVVWTAVLTNAYNGSGAFNLSTNVISPATPDEFFTLTNLP